MEASDRRIEVLIVDDHPLVRDGLGALIRQRADVEFAGAAADGRSAVEAFRRHRPDVTLMDLGLPQMDGVAALKAIRQEFPDARILILSVRGGDEDVHSSPWGS